MTVTAPTTFADGAMVCSVDHRASAAGLDVLGRGGTAADAAIAANAVLTVTAQHMCGLGGDLFALVYHGVPEPDLVFAAGRAGSGVSAAALRADGHDRIPMRRALAAVTVPGCVDGWIALHERHGRLPIAELLRPAIELASGGFEPSPLLVAASVLVGEVAGGEDLAGLEAGVRVTRPGVARTLAAIAERGRAGFYDGEFGAALREMGEGQFSTDDLARSQAEPVAPLRARIFGHDVWTVPPPSQGYLTLSAAWIGEQAGWPADTGSAAWAHVGVEAARAAGHDRPAVLHDRADGDALLAPERLRPRAERIRPDRTVAWGDHYQSGDTMYLCVADAEGRAVSLIQSNAQDFGCLLVAGDTGVFLHNRGIGFSLEPGHPAELAPGRRPPHTLAPALVTRPDGSLEAVAGTMGGDAQPQVVLQLLARLLGAGHDPGAVIGAPRWTLAHPDGKSGFDTWGAAGDVVVRVEAEAPADWTDGLAERGHRVERLDHPTAFGHAHLIRRAGSGWAGAADPRADWSSAMGE